MPDFKAALFDLDGTLIDSMGVWADIDRRFFEKRNMPLPDGYFANIAGLSFAEVAAYTKRTYSLPDSCEDLMREWSGMAYDEYAYRIPLKPGADAYLKKLKAAGVKIALVTTCTKEKYIAALTRLGIFGLFDACVCTDDISGTKADGKAYLKAAELLGELPCDCMVFEDIPTALAGAKKAGMQACLVYDEHSKDKLSESLSLSDMYVRDWRDI